MLAEILKESARRHDRLCPRQVLGARMALYAGELLNLELPRTDKRLLVTSETDGCTVDGIIAATHCRAGSRTLRILDLGKVAATFTDTYTETSLRIVPLREARIMAHEYTPQARNRWEAMLNAYQVMPADRLFTVQSVQLNPSLAQIISSPGRKAVCETCGEEIINGRELIQNGMVICRTCAGDGYYSVSSSTVCDSALRSSDFSRDLLQK
ncbi:MAG: formylmethanofuran dehydrogenase [Chloroflexi bacterium]|nr:formylmethanofuran dehydrogenase [Chloroflexota bacterium]